jgi:hypothetical protein
VIIGIEDRSLQSSFFQRHGGFGSRFAALGVRSPLQNPPRSGSEFVAEKNQQPKRKKKQ